MSFLGLKPLLLSKQNCSGKEGSLNKQCSILVFKYFDCFLFFMPPALWTSTGGIALGLWLWQCSVTQLIRKACLCVWERIACPCYRKVKAEVATGEQV